MGIKNVNKRSCKYYMPCRIKYTPLLFYIPMSLSKIPCVQWLHRLHLPVYEKDRGLFYTFT